MQKGAAKEKAGGRRMRSDLRRVLTAFWAFGGLAGGIVYTRSRRSSPLHRLGFAPYYRVFAVRSLHSMACLISRFWTSAWLALGWRASIWKGD